MIRTCCGRLRLDWRSTRAQSTNVKHLLARKGANEPVTVTGWITHKRVSKNATFLDISDGSTYRPLQAVARAVPERYCSIDMADPSATIGSSVCLQGTMVESRGKQDVELQVKEVDVVGQSPAEPTVP